MTVEGEGLCKEMAIQLRMQQMGKKSVQKTSIIDPCLLERFSVYFSEGNFFTQAWAMFFPPALQRIS